MPNRFRKNGRRSSRWLALGIAGPVVLVTAATAVVPAGAAPTANARVNRAVLKGSSPRWVTREAAANVATPAAPVDVKVLLAPRGGSPALDAAVADVSTPDSPNYRHFLTPDAYRARFEPTDEAVQSVSAWLTASGFQITGVEGSHRYISAHGSPSAASKAFNVTMRNFRHLGRNVQAPTTDASVPADVAGLVTGVAGLDNEPHFLKPGATPAAPPSPGFVNARPCSSYFGQLPATFQADGKTPLPKFNGKTLPYAVCGYTPKQFRNAYGVASTGLTGSGRTIGIIDAFASPTILSDANTYSTRRGDTTFRAGQFSQSNAPRFRFSNECDESGWYGEETLDVEAAHGQAPGANVRYYGAASCDDSDLYDAVARTLDENKVDVVSNSYGEPDESESADLLAQGNQLYQQAALQGISYLFSSGDDGDELQSTGLRQTDSPASNPNVTAVGGTSTAIGPKQGIAFQSGWGTRQFKLSKNGKSWQPNGFLYGAGGGDSILALKPSYQNGVVPASEGGGRAVPDVAMDADPNTGMLVGQTQTFGNRVDYGEYRIGGTSLASPLMGGMVADAAQRVGGRLGFLNPAIYRGVRSGQGQFTDVGAAHVGDGQVRPDFTDPQNATGPIIYSVRTFGQDSSLSLRGGWDETTGVGTPNAAFLTRFGR